MSWHTYLDKYDIPHCTEQPTGDGAHIVLHRLWKNGDRVQTKDGRRWIVDEVSWNTIWCGAQSVTLHELTDEYPDGRRCPDGKYYDRYVGCCPFELRPLGAELPTRQKLELAEQRSAYWHGKFRDLGPWNKQRDDWRRRNWQQTRRETAAAEHEVMELRKKLEAEERSGAVLLTELFDATEIFPTEHVA